MRPPMKTRFRRLLEWKFAAWSRGKQMAALTALSLLGTLAPAVSDAHTFTGCEGAPGSCLLWQTELLSMSLSGGPFAIPLGPGYAEVDSTIAISESSTRRSLGMARATPAGGGPIDTSAGQQFFVDSFFDVFFDITLTDVDPVDNYFNGAPVLGPIGLGPAHMDFNEIRTSNGVGPTFGLIPPVGDAYLGHFDIKIKFGVNFGGGSEPDILEFTLATHTVGNITNTFIEGNTQEDTFDSTLAVNGLVHDQTADPEFSFTLTGPTTARATLVPSPGTLSLMLTGLGLGALRFFRRRS